jgi:RNA polymerase subunit RPABC4/transcription elongation factor Spt4
MEIIKKCEHECPVCGSDNLEWGDSSIEDNLYFYEFTCNSCESESVEWYELVYVETVHRSER